jgi:hypothetical protein
VIVHLLVLLETAVQCQFEFLNPSTASCLSHWQFSESSWRNSLFLFPFTKRQSITKAFVTQKSKQTLSHLGDMLIGADGLQRAHLVKEKAT